MDGEIQLKFRTVAELKAAEETKRALQEAIKVTKDGTPAHAALRVELEKVNAALAGEAANALRVADSLQRAITQTKAMGGNAAPLKQQLAAIQQQHGLSRPGLLGKAGAYLGEAAAEVPGLGRLSSLLNGSTAALGTFAAAAFGAKKAIEEFAQAEERVVQLDAALAQNGLLTDKVREQYQGLAAELQKTTSIADDEWIGVLTRLTQFGARPETIGVDVEAVKNLAGLMGGDVQSAVQAYSRALQGNFEMFGRYGIRVEEAGSQTEKLKNVQEQLAQRGGGQLEAASQSLNGQWRLMKANIGDLFEAFGRWMSQAGVVQAVLYGLGTSAGWLAEKIGGLVPKLDGLRNKHTALARSAADAERSQKSLTKAQEDAKKAVEDANRAFARQIQLLDRLKQQQDELAGKRADVQRTRIRLQMEIGEGVSRGGIKGISRQEGESRLAQVAAGEARGRAQREVEAAEKKADLARKEAARLEVAHASASKGVADTEAKLKKSRDLDALDFGVASARDALADQMAKTRKASTTAAHWKSSPGADPRLIAETEEAAAVEEHRFKMRLRDVRDAEARRKDARSQAGLTQPTAEIEDELAARKTREAAAKAELERPDSKQLRDVIADTPQQVEHIRNMLAEELKKLQAEWLIKREEFIKRPLDDTGRLHPFTSPEPDFRPDTSQPLPRGVRQAPFTQVVAPLESATGAAGNQVERALGQLHGSYLGALGDVAAEVRTMRAQVETMRRELAERRTG